MWDSIISVHQALAKDRGLCIGHLAVVDVGKSVKLLLNRLAELGSLHQRVCWLLCREFPIKVAGVHTRELKKGKKEGSQM